MVDFNVEVSFSGLGLLPAEAIRLGYNSGFKALGLILRVDQCSYDQDFPRLLHVVKKASLYGGIDVVAGVKFVHVPSALLSDSIHSVRSLGAQIILVQGEGGIEHLAQSVEVGTNFSAINAGVDILTCPGMLSSEDAGLAVEKNVAIELTAKYPYSLFNGHIVKMFKQYGFCLTISCDLETQTLFSSELAKSLWRYIGVGSGLEKKDIEDIQVQSRGLLQKIFMKSL